MKLKLSLTLIAAILLSASAYTSVYAECNLETDRLSWNASYNNMISDVNDDYQTFGIDYKMTKDKVLKSEYAVMYILNDNISLADYTHGNIIDFIKSNSNNSIENFYYSTDTFTDYYVRYSNGVSNLQNRSVNKDTDTISLANTINILNKYDNLTGEVTFIRYTPFYLAIISQKGIPKYVIVLDNIYYNDNILDSDPINAKEIRTAFSKLYNSGNGQHVYDFDFFQALIMAKENKLTEDFIYEPKGLQAEKNNKVFKINGLAYYFDKNGICKGLYTGYAQKSGKRILYQNGIAVEMNKKTSVGVSSET